ncbi:MAG TPA: hypothetical protein VMZ71_08780 [Gemmataceae bacterium]|nr:hypothetical protein [Gemmataceae bacterium]
MSETSLARLHRELGFKPLSSAWAKVEIALGLVAVAAGVFGLVHYADERAVAAGALFVLGGYLALAGHRSHLYQSNNKLAAHLAELIRSSPRSGNPP